MTMTRSRNNWAFALLILLAFSLAGIALVWIGPAIADEWWKDVVKDLAIAVLIAATVTGLWRLRGNRMFAQEVLELQNVGESIQNWGIKELSMDWEQIDWKDLFEHSTEISIIQGYGYSWRGGSRQSALETFCSTQGRRLKVALPDPDNDPLMDSLAKRFFTTKDVVRQRVREAAARYLSLRTAKGADVRVYFRDGEPMYAGYLFDSDLVLTLYTHRKAKVANIPVIRARDGDLVDFVKADFKEVFDISKEVPAGGATK